MQRSWESFFFVFATNRIRFNFTITFLFVALSFLAYFLYFQKIKGGLWLWVTLLCPCVSVPVCPSVCVSPTNILGSWDRFVVCMSVCLCVPPNFLRSICGPCRIKGMQAISSSMAGFLGFPVFKQMLRWFPSSELPLHASHAALPT
jgi:hypothetical protein